MRKGKIRALAIVLAIGMIFTLMPNVSVRAEDMGEPEPVVEAQATSEEGVETPVVEEQPEMVVPEVTEPEVTEPEAVVPEAAEPEVTEPKAVVPEAAEPETTADEATVVPAGVTDVTGGNTTNTYTLTYHTKVTTTAQVIIKDADGNVIETTEISKSGDFVEGNVSSDAVQAEIKRIDDEIIAQFSSRGNITTENRNSTMVFDHFESSNLDGDILVGDQDALENVASGSVNKHLDVHEYQVYQTTYDLIVQENNDLKEEQVITKVDVGNIWKELDSTKPVAFTGEVNPNSECADQMTLTEEFWLQTDKIQSDDPSAGMIISSNPSYPIAGQQYTYGVTLTAKDGYFFSGGFAYHGEGGGLVICEGHDFGSSNLDWSGSLSANQKQLIIRFDTIQETAVTGIPQEYTTINNAYIENVKFDYRPGDAPQATAQVSDTPLDQYEIAYECWEEMENGEPVAFWYSDESKYTPSMKRITQFEEGKTYMYSIELREKNGYTFADNCSVKINGDPISASANVIKTVDGLFAMNVETIRPQSTKEISVIEINNATLTFKDGDKPVFTGTVPENDQYAFRCEWWSLDENTGIVSTEPEWGGDIYKNKITAFEAGKTYHYGVYVTAYTADISPDAKLKINGREVEYTRIGDESDTQSFWVETDLAMTPTTAEASDYKIIEGANGTWTKNSDGTLTFRANGDFSKFTSVKVDGVLVDQKNYTAVSGSTIITFMKEYLATLSNGIHKLTVVYTDGECSTNFTVKEAAKPQKQDDGKKQDDSKADTTQTDNSASAPKTGDTTEQGRLIMLVGATAIVIAADMIYRRKRNK